MAILGFTAALVIGLVLGLLGGGGSILTVPVLVYLLGLSPVLATSYSLFVVGVTSLIGSITYIMEGRVRYRAAAVFAVPSLIAVYLTRRYVMPAIPETLTDVGGLALTRDLLIMLVFALLMLGAAYSMLRPARSSDNADTPEKASRAEGESETTRDENPPKGQAPINLPLVFLEGMVVGALTGFVGAGGGFLIIPALVTFAHVPMKQAVGTSLLIIGIKSGIGFLGDIGGPLTIDWKFLALFSLCTIIGVFSGARLSNYFEDERLKPMFGWFIVFVGGFILIRELWSAV